MNKPQTIEGRWWIHGDNKPARFGILSFDPEKGLDLSVKVPKNRTDLQHFRSVYRGKPKMLSCIHGANEGSIPVTLFSCGNWQWSKGKGLDTYRIQNIGAAILNCRIDSLEKACFPFASISYTLLTKWLNRHVRFENDKKEEMVKDGFMCLRFKTHEEMEFELNPDVHLRIAGDCLKNSSTDDFGLGWNHKIWFLFEKALPATVILEEYAYVFLRLLCLLTGERVFIEELNFWDADPFKPRHKQAPHRFELLVANKGIAESKQDTHAAYMIASFDEIAVDFGLILKRWFECHKRLEPVLDLYFAVISNLVLTDESRFLFFAQALEVYHARSTLFSSTDLPQNKNAHKKRVETIIKVAPPKHQTWLKEKLMFSNQKTLAQRIDEILNLHPNEAARLTAKIDDFSTKVRHSRNYYTHYGKKTTKVATGLELGRIMYALYGMLQVCLLKELGIKGKPIERILERNASLKWRDLELVQHAGRQNQKKSPRH